MDLLHACFQAHEDGRPGPDGLSFEELPDLLRIADVGGTGFWRGADLPGQPAVDYGPLNAIARNKVNLDRLEKHWPDMLWVAGSLITNQVRAYDLLRMLTRDGHPNPLGQALAVYGRIAKILHLLAMVDPVDETYRRTVTRQPGPTQASSPSPVTRNGHRPTRTTQKSRSDVNSLLATPRSSPTRS